MQNYLANIQDNQQVISGEYVKNPTNSNFKEMVAHLYPSQSERFELLNSGTYLGGLIDDKISSYVGTPEDSLKYRIDYDKLVETMLTTGYWMLKLSSDDKNGFVLSAIEGQKYYFDGNTEFFIEQYQIEEKDAASWDLFATKYYLYVQTFSNHVLTNKLWEIKKDNFQNGIAVSLDLIPELADRPEEQIIMDIDRIVFTMKAEYSIIEKVKSIIYSIERKWAEADKQFNNYMDQFLVFNNIEIPVDARKTVIQDGIDYTVTDFSKLGKIVETNPDNGNGSIDIIKNGNDLIKEALEFAERQVRQIAAITDIPPIFLGLDSAQGNDSGTSIVKSSGAFYKRIERYRTGIENLFWDVSTAITNIAKTTFVWPSIVTSDPAETIDNEVKKLDAGITSKKMSIMAINNVSSEEADKILEEIRAEQAAEPIQAAPAATSTVMDTVS